MESSQVRLLAALTVVLSVLVGVLWFGSPPEKNDDETATAVISAGFSPADAVALELERNAGEQAERIVLTKRDGKWDVDEPFQAPADVDRIFAVLQTLGSIEKGVPVEGAAQDFGLETPAVVASVTLKDGEKRRLTFGNVAPVGYRSYMRTATGGIAAVTGNPSEELLKRVGEYRDHRVFHYQPGDVTRVSIASGYGLLEATKTDAGWFMTGFGRADLDDLDSWITEMLNLRVELFLDLDHEVIEDPLFQVEVQTNAGTEVLQVGKDTPYGKLVLFGDGLDGVIDHELLQMLERGPSDVGTSRAFPFDATSDTEVRVEGIRQGTWTQREGEWSFPQGLLEVFDEAQVVFKLEPPAWSEPELVVTFQGADGTRRVEIGPADAEGFRAVRELPGAPMRVPVDELAALFSL